MKQLNNIAQHCIYEKGLIGECDFILAKDTHSFDVSFPIFKLAEAPKNDLEEGVRQCAKW